jgi:hypothetical protein
VVRRRRGGLVRRTGAFARVGVRALREDCIDLFLEGRLTLGSALLVVGLMSFTSDRYCDGTASTYYACTNPSTYYFYPSWAIVLVVIGTWFIVLWFLRRRRA